MITYGVFWFGCVWFGLLWLFAFGGLVICCVVLIGLVIICWLAVLLFDYCVLIVLFCYLFGNGFGLMIKCCLLFGCYLFGSLK